MSHSINISLHEFQTLISHHTWRKMGSWDRENFGTVFFDASKNNKKYEELDIPLEPPAVLRIGRDGYISEEAVSRYVDFHLMKLREGDFSFYEEIRQKQKEMIKELKRKTSLFKEKRALDSFVDLYEHLGTLHVLFDFDRTLSDAIEIELGRLCEGDNKNQFSFEHMFDSGHESQALALVRKLRDLKAKKEFGGNCDNEIQLLAEEYGHLGFYQFKGKVFSGKDIEQMMDKLTLSYDGAVESRADEQNEANDDFKRLATLAGDFSAHRLQRVEAVNATHFALREPLGDFFKGYGIEEYWHMVCPQIGAALKKEVSKEDLVPHSETIIYVSSQRICRLDTKDSEAFMMIFSGDKKKSILKGTRASAGTYEGKAKVVLDPSSCVDFEDGDILVCSMTDPNYLPLMIRAGAFVTEKGGILCHAAILARELQKPCLIGVDGLLASVTEGARVKLDCEEETLAIV